MPVDTVFQVRLSILDCHTYCKLYLPTFWVFALKFTFAFSQNTVLFTPIVAAGHSAAINFSWLTAILINFPAPVKNRVSFLFNGPLKIAETNSICVVPIPVFWLKVNQLLFFEIFHSAFPVILRILFPPAALKLKISEDASNVKSVASQFVRQEA